MNSAEPFRAMARNNAWSNHRLLRACQSLSQAAFQAPRTSFFPSIHRTLNHILIVDWYYIDALLREGQGRRLYANETPFDDCRALAAAQAASDRRLVAFCDKLEPPGLEETIVLDRGPRTPPPETVAAILSHLFVHQTHHRGQVHAMLAGTEVSPPQLDEFFLVDDLPLRAGELRALGLA